MLEQENIICIKGTSKSAGAEGTIYCDWFSFRLKCMHIAQCTQHVNVWAHILLSHEKLFKKRQIDRSHAMNEKKKIWNDSPREIETFCHGILFLVVEKTVHRKKSRTIELTGRVQCALEIPGNPKWNFCRIRHHAAAYHNTLHRTWKNKCICVPEEQQESEKSQFLCCAAGVHFIPLHFTWKWKTNKKFYSIK